MSASSVTRTFTTRSANYLISEIMKNTYKLEVKSKRTGKKIKHVLNQPNYKFHGLTDEQMKYIALGVVHGLLGKNYVNVQVFKKNEQGDYVQILAVG